MVKRVKLKRITLRRVVGALLLLIALGYGAAALYFYLVQDELVYHPRRALGATPRDVGLVYQDVTLTTADAVPLHGWFVPAERARATLIYFHGNAGNISARVESIKTFHALGVNVFILDYRGYGRSGGEPSEQGTYRDADAAWRYVTETRGLAPRTIVVYGRSLGGGPASYLAARERPAGLILEAAFTSVPDVGSRLYPWLPVHWLARIHYPVQENLARVQVPVLIVHSRADQLVPFAQAERNFAAAHEPKLLLEIDGPHDGGTTATRARYLDGLEVFLRAALR